MDPAFITPFIKSVQNVFNMMLQLDVTVEDPRLKTDAKATYDVSGIIGLSGDVVGSAVLSFPTDAAERIVALFTGEELSVEHPDFADAIGELINMVTGNAKADFAGRNVSISCPNVVRGKDHTIARPREIPTVLIPCTTDCGELMLEISLQDASSNAAAAGSAAGAANAA